MRVYAQRRLDAGGEEIDARGRHRDHYLALAETAAPHLESADAGRWHAQLDADYLNLETSLTWSREHNDIEVICRMVTALCPIWTMGGTGVRLPASAGIEWIDTALATENILTPRMRGLLMFHRSILAFVTLDLEKAAIMGQETQDRPGVRRRSAARPLPCRRRSGTRPCQSLRTCVGRGDHRADTRRRYG